VRGGLLDTKRVRPVHLKVVTNPGVIYLMGRGDRGRADEAVEIARNTGGVRKVVKCSSTASRATRLAGRRPVQDQGGRPKLSGRPPVAVRSQNPRPARGGALLAGLARPLSLPTASSTSCTAGMSPIWRGRGRGASLLSHSIVTHRRAARQGRRAADNPLADRLAVVAALEAVSAVTSFEKIPRAADRLVPARCAVKGGDWPVERIVGAQAVLAAAGALLSIPFEHERSTSALVQRIKSSIET